MTIKDALLPDQDGHRPFDELGVARVRALLRDEGQVPNPGWRREAQQWLDERLRREGERTYALVLASIFLVAGAIVVLAYTSW